MYWSSLQPGFCESVISGPPEIINSITSCAMIFYGLMGLFVTRNHNILLRVIAALLVATGIGSVIYHWTLYTGWSQVDGLPMLIASYLGAYQSLDSIIYKKISLDRGNKRMYEILSGILSMVLMIMLSISLGLSTSDDTMKWFSILFAIPEIMIALAVIIIRIIYNKDMKTLDEKSLIEVNKAFNIMYIGFGSAILAAIIWITTEHYCKIAGNEWIRYLYAHGLWHIAISLGMYFLIQCLVFMYMFNKDNDPYFIKGNKWYSKIFYILVPIIKIKVESEKVVPNNCIDIDNNNNRNYIKRKNYMYV
jgi:hypothetical protein